MIPSGRIIDANWRHLRFGYGSEHSYYGVPATFRRIIIPYWFLFTITALYPCLRAVGYWKHRHKAPNLCHTCGYDLRATPTRCPECGHEPPQKLAHPAPENPL